ncbi:Ig-like domain-containing protein [Metabacillus fastidiosus]|nr:Ig-like domain-containing protein [Metabacillus fastidiosus]
MSKKKVAKLGLTAAVAATTVVAATPADAASVSTTEKAVQQAAQSANALVKYYSSTDLKVDAEFTAAFNNAKKAIANAKAAVAQYKGKEKAYYEATVAKAESHQSYAARYIDAVGILNGKLVDSTKEVSAYIKSQELNADTVAAYDRLSAEIKKAEAVIGKVRGAQVREAFKDSFLLEAKLTREALIYEVSQYQLLNQINEKLKGEEVTAKGIEADFAKLERLKERAVAIKEAGKLLYPDRDDVYPEHKAIEQQLRNTEKDARKAAEDKFPPAVKSVQAVADITVDEGKAAILPEKVEVILSNGEKAEKAVTWENKDLTKVGEYTLKGKVADTELEATVKVTVRAVAPEVESVSAVNGKTIEVKFSAPVDAKTLKASDKDVITIAAEEGANNAGTVTQELSADGKTLTLTASNYFKGDYTVKVPFEVVKATNGKYVSALNQKISVDDKVAPVLASAKATVKSTSDKVASVTLTFTEEVSSIDLVKIAGGNYSPVIKGNTATISNLELDPTKAYEVTVVNAKDAAGNTKDVQAGQLNIAVDNAAPSITNVVATGENTVKVTLDKALKDNSLVVTGKIGTFSANVIDSIKVNEENNKEYTVTLKNDYLFKSGSSDVVTLTVEKEKLTDVLGNTNSAEITKTVTVSKDTVAPAVTKVDTTVTNGKVTAFTVNFAEEVKSLDTSKVYVVNSKGEILALSNVATSKVDLEDNKKVVFTLDNALKADTYSFDLLEGFVTDKSLAANKNAKYSFSVNVADAAQPVETAFTIKSAEEADNVITVDFGQKVKATGTGSALNPLAYALNGVVLPSDAKVDFVVDNGTVDQTKVKVTLPEGFVKTSDDAAVFRVTGVQSLDNKVSNPFIQTIDVTDNTAPVALSFVATDLTKLTVTYSEAVKLATIVEGSNDVSDEIKLYNSKGEAVAIEGAAIADGKLVLTVADATAVTKLTTVTTETADVVDTADLKQKAGITLSK